MERKQLTSSRKVPLRSLEDLDRRTVAVRAAFQLRDAVAADLGGAEHLTAAQQTIVSNVALLTVALQAFF